MATRTRLILAAVVGLSVMGGSLSLMAAGPSKATESASAVRLEESTMARPAKAKPIRQALHPDEPVSVRIPALHIDATVRGAGLNRTGEMEAPATRDGVSWYKYGYLPGSPGNAVMAGHSDFKGTPGVFASLRTLQEGDLIEVVTKEHIATFAVYTTQTYHPDDAGRDALFGPDSEAILHLITCDGGWDATTKRYTERLVVSARFVKEEPLTTSLM